MRRTEQPSYFPDVDALPSPPPLPFFRSHRSLLPSMASRVLSRASTLENKLDSLSIHDEAPPEQLKRTSVAHKPANPKVRLLVAL